MLLSIPRKILNISPICSSREVIFSSAIACVTTARSLYVNVRNASFIIGIIHIPITIITPTSPTAFFKIIPQPKTVSTASPKILPTTGIAELTTALVVLAVIPST